MPQFVWMWFHCDHEGCEIKTEHMVRIFQTSHAQFMVQSDDGGWGAAGTDTGLPPGWKRTLYSDRVFCPDHVSEAR